MVAKLTGGVAGAAPLRPPRQPYLVAIGLAAAAVGLRMGLDPWLGEHLALVMLFPAVAVVVWYGGYRPAMLTAVLGYLACAYLFIDPRGQLFDGSPRNIAGILAFAVSSAVVIALGEGMRRARRRARRGRDLLQVTLSSIGDAVITTDADGRVTGINSVAEALTGWTETGALGRPLDEIFRIIDEKSRQSVESPAARVFRDGTVVGLANHTLLVARDGSEHPIDDSAAPIRGADDEIIGCVLVFRDVTARREADRAVRRSEHELSDFFENASVGLHQVGPDGIILRANQAELDMMGYARDEYVGRPVAEFHVDQPVIDDILHRLGRGEILREVPARLRRKDGTILDVLISSSVYFEDGRFIHTRCFTIDVTAKRRAEQALQRSEERFRELANNIDQFAWTCDELGYATWYNRRWYDYTGTTFEDMQGEGWKVVHHPDHLERVQAGLARCVQSGEPWEDTFPLRARDGSYRWFLSRAVPIRDESGRVVRWFGTNTDITERLQLEDALRDTDRRKDEFLATLAHELRNPLAPMRTAVQILLTTAPNEAGLRPALDVIERQVQQMVRLLDDLLDMSRISHGKLELRREVGPLAAIVASAVETSRPLLDARRHRLEIALPDQPVYVDADPVRLAQVFANLLNNAAKYTNPGGLVRLEARVDGRQAVVSVEDNGMGISEAVLPRVFDMFSQEAGAMDRSQEGLGVGLALVRGLVELHGGDVTAESGGAGQGSRFTVRLPVAEAAAASGPEARPELPADVPRRRLLVVDDRADSADSLAELLRLNGHEAHAAYDGRQAIETAERIRPDAVLLDIGMPNVNGYDVCREIRAMPWGRDVLLIALTGWGQEEARRSSEAAGFDHHLVKPVDPNDLLRLVGEPDQVEPS